MKRTPILALLVFLAALLLTGCRETIPTSGSIAAAAGVPTPAAITVASAYAAPDLTLLRNGTRPQLLNFFAYW